MKKYLAVTICALSVAAVVTACSAGDKNDSDYELGKYEESEVSSVREVETSRAETRAESSSRREESSSRRDSSSSRRDESSDRDDSSKGLMSRVEDGVDDVIDGGKDIVDDAIDTGKDVVDDVID